MCEIWQKHTQKRTRACACAIGILAKRTCACDVRAAENRVCECACEAKNCRNSQFDFFLLQNKKELSIAHELEPEHKGWSTS